MKGLKNVLKIVLIIILFPFVIAEMGKYIDDIYDDDMYYGGS